VTRTKTIIIGAGQAGLAMSRCLRDRDIDHVVLERGRVAERWRSERWDSLRLLTPNWQSRLPGFQYDGADPGGFMTMPEVVRFFEQYAADSRAPVETDTSVRAVERDDEAYRVETDRGTWRAPTVVVATGYCDTPYVPPMAGHLSGDVYQTVPSRYRNPAQLPGGGVLVVGASASGIQLADEIQASGRPVTLAVGRHTRLPRRYRNRDIFWWMDRMGIFDEAIGKVFDPDISRHQPSLQLVGRPDHATLGLPELHARGVRLMGRLAGIDGTQATFDDSLVANASAADVKLASIRSRIDAFVANSDLAADGSTPEPFEPSWPLAMNATTPEALDLHAEGIRTVVWATGFRREYPWLKVPVFDRRGEI
jgi:putative flavoprotein involved in K+ transport